MNSMFNWKSMCSNERGFDGLYDELRSSGGLYILDNVKMPDTCNNCNCTIEFKYYSDCRIILTCSDAPLIYSGYNNQIAEWVTTGICEFSSFNDLKSFLSEFKFDTVNSTPSETQRDMIRNQPEEVPNQSNIPDRPKMRYNKANLTVPIGKKSYILLDKDKLVIDLKEEIYGQDENILKIVHLVANHLATKHNSRPLSIFLYGPTGVGKSGIVEELVNSINCQLDSKDHFAYRTFDCTQCKHDHDISKLIGAPPGYVGHDEPGVFSILEDNPNTVFVFEEIEKGSDVISETIMQAMETGRQETNGKTLKNGECFYDLSRSIFFFTSNIELKEKKRNLGFATETESKKQSEPQLSDLTKSANIARMINDETKQAKKLLAETGRFKREVAGRMNAIMKFNTIPAEFIPDIAAKCIGNLAAKNHYLYVTELGDDILQDFLNETADEVAQSGVRAIRNNAVNFFSDALREYSHSHDDYSYIRVSGSLDNIIITEGLETGNEQ